MKTAHDPRHVRRIERMQALYTYSLSGERTSAIADVLEKLPQIDAAIEKAATEHGVDHMNKVDLAILRQSVLELMEGTNPSVVIDEAIEIAKSFGAENSPRFVNGALSKIMTFV